MTEAKTFRPHASWGNSIYFFNGAPPITEEIPLEQMTGYTVTGHKPRAQMPKNGEQLEVEYHKYIITFALRDLRVMRDPPDQFFCKADLNLIRDYSGNVLWQRHEEQVAA